jgi:hypothetical protein
MDHAMDLTHAKPSQGGRGAATYVWLGLATLSRGQAAARIHSSPGRTDGRAHNYPQFPLELRAPAVAIRAAPSPAPNAKHRAAPPAERRVVGWRISYRAPPLYAIPVAAAAILASDRSCRLSRRARAADDWGPVAGGTVWSAGVAGSMAVGVGKWGHAAVLRAWGALASP